MDTQDKIRNIATKHFARYGYQGASLSKIAAEVGIKKPSLYAHYDSKLSLFESCMDQAQLEFTKNAEKILSTKDNDSAETQLYSMLSDFVKPDKEFYIRFAFMPPEEITQRDKYPNNFINIMSDIMDGPITEFTNEHGVKKDQSKEIKEAYLCMLDGLMVEYIFGDINTYKARLKAAWSVFMKGVK